MLRAMAAIGQVAPSGLVDAKPNASCAQSLASADFFRGRPLSLKELSTACRVERHGSGNRPRRGVAVQAVLSEPPPFVRDYSTAKEPEEEPDFGSGLGVLYDTPQRGLPEPLGAEWRDGGVNFAVYSSGATAVSVCLFTVDDLKQGVVSSEVPLHAKVNKTGDTWHIFLPGLSSDLLYGYRVDGPMLPHEGHRFDATKVLLDPYAKAVISRNEYGMTGPEEETWVQMAGMVPSPEDEFDWEGDTPPGHALKDLVIYEMHVRGFTRHPSSHVQHPGTYRGLAEKLPYLRSLGVNAVELMPINEFNELEYYVYNPASLEYKYNFWGYSPVSYFSPMIRYASAGAADCGRAAVREFKQMVKECHRHGIEVILDVVFNHTAEGNEMGPTVSFRGLDNRVYYMTAPKGEFYNYSGCGNTFNCNHPVVRNFILDCLKYWVVEMHVDGFRFDLASIMTRASSLWDKANVYGRLDDENQDIVTGTPLTHPPLLDMISNDPVLRDVKLIAEAWDAGGLYQVGSFPHWGRWAEWNGQFRDTVRQFIKGTDGMAGSFADVICGSAHLYRQGGRNPSHSINFITAHDGFTLRDLVTYNDKKNIANGENNNDGENHNLSWNCGEEGELAPAKVQSLRQRQMRNFMVALFTAHGVPMLLMGDEYGHTKHGNNNTYCHDSELNYMVWNRADSDDSGFLRFVRHIIDFRRSTSCFRAAEFPTGERVQWHGLLPHKPDWSETNRLIAFTIRDDDMGEIYVAFNASHLPLVLELPERHGQRWLPLVDTSKPAPFDFLTPDLQDYEVAVLQYETLLASGFYPVMGYSSIILVSGPA